MYFNFTLYNPFCKNSKFENIFSKFGNFPIKNKGFEFEILKYTGTLFKVEIKLNFRGCDHAGPEFSIGLFCYELSAKVYDYRHWDNKKRCWENE